MPAPPVPRRAFLFQSIRPAPPRVRACDRYADVPLVDQYGERHRFRDGFLDGRALVIHTMYTACSGTCPGTITALVRLRKALSPVFGERMTFVSITLDPENDTPEVLRDYAGHCGAGEKAKGEVDWRFLTGRPADVEALRRSLGFYDLDPRVDADRSRHGTLLLFGNSESDRWASLPSGLRQPLLVEAIRRVAGSTFEQRYGIRAEG